MTNFSRLLFLPGHVLSASTSVFVLPLQAHHVVALNAFRPSRVVVFALPPALPQKKRFAHLLSGPVTVCLCYGASAPFCPYSLCRHPLSCVEVPRSGRRGIGAISTGTCQLRPRLLCARDGELCSVLRCRPRESCALDGLSPEAPGLFSTSASRGLRVLLFSS